MLKIHSRLVVLGVFSAVIAWAQSKPARQIAQQAFPSVVLVVMQDDHGQTTALGSGFVLRDGQVVTNRHVIAGAVGGFVRLVDRSAKFEIAGTVAVDDAHDLAVVAATGLKAPSLPLGDSNQIAVGDEVYAIGNPRGLEGTFSQGIVSAIRRVGGDTIIQMTAPISPGSSGGPILNGNGEVVGIAVATFTGGQNLNLAIPVSYLTALTGGITSEVRPLTRQAKVDKRSVIGGLGEPIAQGVVGENFEWEYPDSGDSIITGGRYSFSLRNQLQEAVTSVQCLIIFRDAQGRPIDTDSYEFNNVVIRGMLAKRVSDLRVNHTVQQLVEPKTKKIGPGRVEIRVLDFRLVQ
jgi:S1-C subfamily serine protease